MSLVAHLRGDFVFAGEFGQDARLEDGVRQRFLAVNMFAQSDGHRCCGGVRVVRRRDGHSVDVIGFLVEHLAEVSILGRLRVAIVHVRSAAGINVAKGHDVLALAPVDIDLPLTTGADCRDVKSLVRAKHTPRDDHREGDRASDSNSSTDEFSTPNWC